MNVHPGIRIYKAQPSACFGLERSHEAGSPLPLRSHRLSQSSRGSCRSRSGLDRPNGRGHLQSAQVKGQTDVPASRWSPNSGFYGVRQEVAGGRAGPPRLSKGLHELQGKGRGEAQADNGRKTTTPTCFLFVPLGVGRLNHILGQLEVSLSFW